MYWVHVGYGCVPDIHIWCNQMPGVEVLAQEQEGVPTLGSSVDAEVRYEILRITHNGIPIPRGYEMMRRVCSTGSMSSGVVL